MRSDNTAADAERRRVERDLHNGAQQHLVALAVSLRLSREIIADDPGAGGEMLAQMAEDIQVTIKELCELAHGIYPPLLAGAGLPEALRAAAGRCAIPVSVSADGIGRYSQGVETAVYFCCLEAGQNAVKHAPGRALRCGSGRSPAGSCSRSATTGGASIPSRRARATALSTWRTAQEPSAARSAGSQRPGRDQRSADRCR